MNVTSDASAVYDMGRGSDGAGDAGGADGVMTIVLNMIVYRICHSFLDIFSSSERQNRHLHTSQNLSIQYS